MSKYDFIDDIDELEPEDPSSPAVHAEPNLQPDTALQEAWNVAQTIPEHAAAAGLNALQAPSLGFSDEIMSNIPLLRDAEQFRAEHRSTYPAAGAISELSSAIGTGVAAGPSVLAQTAKLGSPLARGAANLGVGAGAGGLYGLGTGEGGLLDRLPGAALEAGIAAAAGPAAYIGGRLASTVADPIMEYGGRLFRSADEQASTVIGRERSSAGIPTDMDYDARVRDDFIPNISGRDDLDDLITNADIDPSSRQQLKELYDQNPQARAGIEEFLKPRQLSASRRTVDDISDIAGVNRDSTKAIEELAVQARRDAAATGYGKLYENNIPVDNELGEMFLGPEGADLRKAYKNAESIAAREGDPIPSYNQVFGEDGTLESLPLKAVDYMQRVFRNAGKPNIADPTYDHISWRRLRDRFLGTVDEMVPEFKEVRKTYASQKSIEDALGSGRDIYKMGDARDIQDYLNTLSGPEADAFRRGAVDAVEARLRNARIKSGNVETHIQGTANQEDILRLVFGDRYDDVAKVLSREDAFNTTYSQVLGGSPTSRNVRGGASLGGVDMRGHTPTDRLLSATGDLASRWVGGGQHPTTIDAMVKQLLAKGYTPEQAQRIARAGMSDEMVTRFGRGAAGVGALSAPGPIRDWAFGDSK